MVLRVCYAVSGTEIAAMLLPGSAAHPQQSCLVGYLRPNLGYLRRYEKVIRALAAKLSAGSPKVRPPIALCACYAISGTAIHSCYAISGTDYASATSSPVLPYTATKPSPVLTPRAVMQKKNKKKQDFEGVDLSSLAPEGERERLSGEEEEEEEEE
eukprot:1393853-Rhodomonas_salina.5